MKFGLLFEIQVPKPWQARSEYEKLTEALEQAILAEELGFDSVWVVEHHFLEQFSHSGGPEVWLGALSQRTNRIRLGHGVVLMPGQVNHPIRAAERAATLDILSDGRLEFGTGRSSSQYQLEPFGVDLAHTQGMWEEAVDIIPKMWTQERFSHQGTYWTIPEVNVLPKPLQKPHPPIWAASTQPDTCALIGSKGIGLLLPTVGPPSDLSERIEQYRREAASPKRQAGLFINNQVGAFTIAYCDDDDATAREVGGPAAIWYTKTIRQIYSNDFRGQPLEAIPPSYRWHYQRRSGGTTSVPASEDYHSLINQGAFCIGDPDHCISILEKYEAIGLDHVLFICQVANLSHEKITKSMRMFGKYVLPYFWEKERRATLAAAKPAGNA